MKMDFPDRFLRSKILYGEDFCRKLAKASALVCGLGAVGGYCVELLARMGVYNFILADCDEFELSNINRQIGALESTLGKRKTDVMKARILDINPYANVETFDGFIDGDSINFLFAKKPNVVVDAIDTIQSKILLACKARENGLRLVSSMGAARRKDVSCVKTALLTKTYGCPMASKIRKELRKIDESIDFMCVFSNEVLEKSTHLASGAENSEKVIGSSALITSIFGIILADLAISEILKND